MGRAFAAALAYALISALWIFQNPAEVWPGLGIRLDGSAGNAAVVLTLVSALAAFSSKSTAGWLVVSLLVLGYLNSFLVLYFGHGIFHASSMDTAATALFFPLFVDACRLAERRGAWLFLLPPIAAILFRHGSTAFAMLFVMGLAQIFYSKRKVLYCSLSFVVLAVGGALYYHYVATVLGFDQLTSGRAFNWSEGFTWWAQNANQWLGTGTGTYQWIGPSVHNQKTLIFLWMHNEYLQALFEQGWLGLGLFLLVGGLALKKSFATRWLFTSLVGLSVACLTQFPFRFFVTQLFIVLLIRFAQDEKSPVT